MQLDDFFIAKVAGLALLGIYTLAFKVANDSILFLIATLREILLPAFVKLKDNAHAFSQAALRAVGTLSALSWILGAAVFASADEIMMLISPNQDWRGAETVLKALMPFVVIRAINGIFGAMAIAVGRPQILSTVASLQLLLLLPAMWAGYHIGQFTDPDPLAGVIGITCAIALVNLTANIAMMAWAHRELQVNFWKSTGLMWLMMPATLLCSELGPYLKFSSNLLLNLLTSLLGVILLGIIAWEFIARIPWLATHLESPTSLIQKIRRKP